jgi:hypothetical protein
MNFANFSKNGWEFSHDIPDCVAGREEIALQKDQVHSWSGNRLGMTIEAREGTIWLTQCGDCSDIILSRGESFRVTRPGRVVAQGLSASTRVIACRWYATANLLVRLLGRVAFGIRAMLW